MEVNFSRAFGLEFGLREFFCLLNQVICKYERQELNIFAFFTGLLDINRMAIHLEVIWSGIFGNFVCIILEF